MNIAYIGFGARDIKPWHLEDQIQNYDAVVSKLMLSKSCRPWQSQYDSYLEQLTEQSPDSRTTKLLQTGDLTDQMIDEIVKDKIDMNKRLRAPTPFRNNRQYARGKSREAYCQNTFGISKDIQYQEAANKAKESTHPIKFGYEIVAAQIAQTHDKPFVLVKGFTPYTLDGEIDSSTALRPLFGDQTYHSALSHIATDSRKATAMLYQRSK